MDREETKLRVKEATDLVALIESYLPLKPRGRLLVALCPFHAENSPSFTVYADRQFYRCYGCGKTGDVFSWLMERDGLTFPEALELLAERAGIPIEKSRGSAPSHAGPNPFDALDAVAGFFQQALLAPGGQLARDYLDRRGLGEAIATWRLGVHPAPGALSQFAQEKRLPRDVLEAAGLLRGGRELFAHRLMFPIEDERGRIVGFGGRIVPGAPGGERSDGTPAPKYYNSPESPFFNKRRLLFGLHRSKQAGQRRIVVMEGYTDVIACHLAGFTGAVASLGTAFTADHARTVERYATEGLVLMFDGDRAGMQAAERAVRELANSRLTVRIAMMGDADEGAKDPADVVVARQGEDLELVAERRARFADTIDGAEDAIAVWFRLLRKRLDLSQAVHVDAAARECASILARVESPVRQAALVEQMARHLAVPAPDLRRLLDKEKRPKSATPAQDGATAAPAAAPRPTPMDQAETLLLACVLAAPQVLERLDVADCGVRSQDVQTLLGQAVDGVALGRTAPDALVRYLMSRTAEEPDLQRRLADASDLSLEVKEPAAAIERVLVDLRRNAGEASLRTWRQQLQDALAAGDQQRAGELQQLLLARLREDRPRPTAGVRNSATLRASAPPPAPPSP